MRCGNCGRIDIIGLVNILDHISCVRSTSDGSIFFHWKDTQHWNLKISFLASTFLFMADHHKQFCLPSDEKSHNPVCLSPLYFVIYIKLKCKQFLLALCLIAPCQFYITLRVLLWKLFLFCTYPFKVISDLAICPKLNRSGLGYKLDQTYWWRKKQARIIEVVLMPH